mgnify:CR=1 FL=1
MDLVRSCGIALLLILLSACNWFSDPETLFAQAREAYAGRFENQTRVNLDLLDAVLSVRDGNTQV